MIGVIVGIVVMVSIIMVGVVSNDGSSGPRRG